MKCWNKNIKKPYNIGKTGLALPPRQGAPLTVGGEHDVTSREHAEATHWTKASNNQEPTWKERRRVEELEVSNISNAVVGVGLTQTSECLSQPELVATGQIWSRNLLATVMQYGAQENGISPSRTSRPGLDWGGQLDQHEICWASRCAQTQLHLSMQKCPWWGRAGSLCQLEMKRQILANVRQNRAVQLRREPSAIYFLKKCSYLLDSAGWFSIPIVDKTDRWAVVLVKESCEPWQVGVITARASAVLESFGTGSGLLEKHTSCVVLLRNSGYLQSWP